MKIPKKYWNIARRLSTAQLQKDNYDQDYLKEEDLFNINIGKRGHSFFLGYYSKEGLKLVFEKYDAVKIFNEKGFTELVYDLDTSDPYVHRLVIYDKFKKPERMLVEIVLKKSTIKIDMPFETKLNGKRYDTLGIEWMCLQNPYANYTKKRPRLPGQQHPGLGMASKAIELLIISAWRLKLAGLVNIPDNYHNAYLYSRIFYYINPEDQAKFMAFARDTKKYPLNVVAWALEWGAVTDEILNEPAKWFVAKQLVPLDSELKKLFNSKVYQNLAKEKAKEYKFRLDFNEYEKMKQIKEI